MADQQPGNGSAEPLSYDADMLADVRGAWDENVTETPAAETETPAAAPADRQPTTPGEPKAEHPTDPTRYADGKFKPTKEDVAQQAANEQHAKAASEQQPQPQPQAQPQPKMESVSVAAGGPPPGWSIQSKATWEQLPEHIRADVIKREYEVSNGLAQYQDVAELRDYAQLARSQGQSPRAVIERYISAEQNLRQDFIGGMVSIGGGMGYTPQQIALAMQQLYLGSSTGQSTEGYQQSSDQQQGYQQPADPAYLQQWINPLAQKIQYLERLVQQQYEAEQNRQAGTINGVLQQFVQDPAHRYFDNVQDTVIELFRTGAVKKSGDYMTDLKRAYKMACADNDEIQAALFKERVAKDQAAKAQQQKEAAEKARHASRSITGSPSTGAARDFGDGDDSVEADVRRAFRAHAV